MNTLVDESVAFGLNTFMHAPLVYQVSLFREIVVENGKHVSRKEHMVQKRPQILFFVLLLIIRTMKVVYL